MTRSPDRPPRVQVPRRVEISRALPELPRGPPNFLYVGSRFSPGVKRRGLDADYPPLLAHKLRMGWSYTSAFLLRLHWNVSTSPLPLLIFLLNLYRPREATGRSLLYLIVIVQHCPACILKARGELSLLAYI